MFLASGGPLVGFLRALLGHLGGVLGPLGAILGRLGAVLSRLETILSRLHAVLDPQEAQGAEIIDFPQVVIGFEARRVAPAWKCAGCAQTGRQGKKGV